MLSLIRVNALGIAKRRHEVIIYHRCKSSVIRISNSSKLNEPRKVVVSNQDISCSSYFARGRDVPDIVEPNHRYRFEPLYYIGSYASTLHPTYLVGLIGSILISNVLYS